ncbi:lytic murein transglycosylase [Limoniibacter endophyticus]|uniref:Membrane protein n=1 Tax=Limoniibacter endophyticus TaxID=1565040 RepID=A0A8J3DLC3_9HYPH|nr:lytic murein transglycosylase [Limoniibacter endophyticus]GHC67287.1 membrane protein [Limoniibacter endophyticus]
MSKRLRKLILSCVLLAVAVLPARADINGGFRQWLANDLWPEARSRGVSERTFRSSFEGMRPNLDLPDLVIPGRKQDGPRKQHQAEFRSPAAYFAENTLGGVTAGGRARARNLGATLQRIERQYGVPGHIALAIWGRESAFGTAKIPHDAMQVLATKAFLAARKEMFREEVLAALEMIQKGLATRATMKSSWAGALGQPQFMPTSYLRYAVDGDGDGRADIWNSDADTLASIANYLAQKGWVRGRDWGFEVTVPASVSCALEGPDQGRRISDWAALGIARVGGKAFPPHETNAEAYLLMPAGRYGPAFIVTPNFYVLKAYNESDAYALFVGHAGDRIAYGDSRFAGGWQKTDALYRSEIASVQNALVKLGYDVGGADGLPGFKTRRSIGHWQAKNDLSPTCFPDRSLVSRLK